MIALTALALAGRPLSAHVLAWCVSRNLRVRPGVVFIVTMTPIALGAALAGATIYPIPDEVRPMGVQALVGLGLGGVLIAAEWAAARFSPRKDQRQLDSMSIDARLRTDPLVTHAGGIARIYRNWLTPQKMAIARPWALLELCIVAIVEEVLYRGVVGFVALTFETPIAAIGLLAVSTVLFGLSHDAFGPRQIVLKAIYAAILTGVTLLTGSLLPALVAHLALNIFSWTETRRWMRAIHVQGTPR